MKIPHVALELLRQGPPHNQLLSPLTSYLAVCGNHEPEPLRVPFEHATLLRKLRSVRGAGDPVGAAADAEDVRRAIVEMLCSLRGLQRELSTSARGGASLVALELIVSAHELALLPFELAFPPGVPTRELAASEVVVLRRSRRVPSSTVRWPVRPRILFAYAGQVPYERHLLALRECLEPWLTHAAAASTSAAARKFAEYVTVLPEATLPRLQEAVRGNASDDREFTHVHVLAHGDEDGGKFGLRLCHPNRVAGSDLVSGARLASALTATASDGARVLPACVTLAACDAGNFGDVTYFGAAVAHELHEAGVPLVVASQFPLSIRGSVAMACSLYEGLLRADDPRLALTSMRNTVRTWGGAGASATDWASFVAYGALPRDLDRQVTRGRVEQAKRVVESVLGRVDPWVVDTQPAEARIGPTELNNARRLWSVALRRFEDVAPPAERAWYMGAVLKRWAEACAAVDAVGGEWGSTMRDAERRYREAFSLTGDPSALVQALACLAFHGGLEDGQEPSPERLWHLSVDLLALRRAPGAAPDRRALLELWMIAPAFFPELSARREAEARLAEPPEEALRAALTAEADDFELYSLSRQARRFEELPLGGAGRYAAVRDRAEVVLAGLKRLGAPSKWSAVMDYRRSAEGPVRVPSKGEERPQACGPK